MKWISSIALTSALTLGFSGTGFASTFVGNGGNSADVEWQVALKQISAAVAGIEKDPPDDELLCSCNQTYANASTCDALNQLTSPQRKFCGATLKKQIHQLAPLVRDTNTVRVSWTNEEIDVLEDGQRRYVDAVTDRQRGSVTLNADRFRSLNPSERVFLISHELQHLTTLDGKPLSDEGAVGPYTAKDGSRQLINAMAAALVIEAEEAGAFERYSPVLKRPQGWKENWIDANFQFGSSGQAGTYNVRDFEGGAIRFTHYLTAFGVNAEYSTLRGRRSVLGDASTTEQTQTLRVGVSYRLFPFKDPLTSIGQSNLALSADVDFVHGDLNFHDSMNDETVRSDRVGASAQARYYFPIAAGFWLDLAESYVSLPSSYTFGTIKIENDKNIFVTSIGVSYAF